MVLNVMLAMDGFDFKSFEQYTLDCLLRINTLRHNYIRDSDICLAYAFITEDNIFPRLFRYWNNLYLCDKTVMKQSW